MQTVVLVVHLLVAMTLIITVLLQRSEGGGLGIGGGGGAGGGLMSGRGAASVLTRATAILAACFFATSIIMSIMASRGDGGSSIFDTLPMEAPIEEAIPELPVFDPAELDPLIPDAE